MQETHKDRQSKDLDEADKRDCKPAYKKHPENNQKQDDSIPADLAEVIALWPDLPDNIKEAIRAIVKPFRK